MYYVINSMFLFIFIVFFDCRCCYHHYNDDVTTHFLLLKHFWPYSTMFYIKMKDFTMTVIKKKEKKSLWL